MLLRVAEARNLPGTKPADYSLPSSVPVRDGGRARLGSTSKPLWRELRAALPADPVTGEPAADPTGRAGTDWLAQLFRKLDFGALTEVGAQGIPADSDPEKRFPVSHRHGPALIHLIPWNQELDKRPAAGQVPAQSMLQDCLNRTEAHLWAALTNGRRLRLLRDSSSFATAALRRIRPGGHLRRRAVQRVRAAVLPAARVPLHGARGGGTFGVLAGEVAHGRHRVRQPGPRTLPDRCPGCP